jgi:hypothetical protein
VDADLDTLVTALYVRVDDLLKTEPGRVPPRPRVGIAPRLADAELVTLAVMQALLGFTSEARWLRYSHANLRALFPYLPQQSGYNKRLRGLVGTLHWLIGVLARDTSVWTDDVWVIDSTPVECARSREKLDILHADPSLTSRGRQLIIGDKNYYGADFEAALPEAGIELLRPARKGETERPGARFFKPLRQVIESINDTFKGQLDLERHGGRTKPGVIARVWQRILALTATIWFNDRTGQPVLRSLTAYDH